MAAGGRSPNAGRNTLLCLNFASSVGESVKSRSFPPESTYRFEYKRAPKSCEGDPAPGLELPIDPGAGPNGVLPPPEPEPDRSLGELRPVEVPDMGWVVGM